MPLINCQACSAEISSQSSACPKCGHPTKKSVAEQKKVAQQKAVEENPMRLVIGWGLVLFVMFGLFNCMGSDDKDKPKVDVFSESDAFYLCESAMKLASKYPDKSDIPFIRANELSTEFAYAWGAGTEHMMWMNGLGMMVPTSGSCVVNKQTQAITMLTINGKTII